MKYQAIIFDMDGTIVDTENIWNEAAKRIIQRRNIILTPEQEQELEEQIHGLSAMDSCLFIKQWLSLDDEASLLQEEKRRFADSLYTSGLQFVEGFLPFFKHAQDHCLKIAIATNATYEGVIMTDKALGLKALFGEHIYTVSHVKQSKPEPDVYLYAAEQLEIAPRLCIAIEDSAHGITAAKKAGMFCIGINTAQRPKTLYEADMIIDSYHELDLAQLLQTQE